MSVSGATSTTNTTATSSHTLGQSTDPAAIQSQFLTLLVSQLKNQDPMNPMDSAQMTSQMAQISTVSGIQQLNTTVSALSNSLLDNQASQAINLIGKGVAVPGQSLTLHASGTSLAAEGAVWLNSAADNATIKIQDANGKPVRSLQLSNLPAGLQNFSWDGLSDSGAAQAVGNYHISVSATQGGQSVTVQPLQWGVVGSIERDATGSGWNLALNGGTTLISLSDVKSVISN